MAWITVGICAFVSLILFLTSVRNANRVKPYSGELCDLYLLKHMLPDGHFLKFMYVGLPRIRRYPRLLFPCISTFANLAVVLSSIICAAVISAQGLLQDQTIATAVLGGHTGAIVFLDFCLMGIPAMQNRQCLKEMMRMDFAQALHIRAQIEQKWPGFFASGR